MQPENSIPVAGQPPASDKDGKAVQAEAQSDTEPFDAEGESLPELRKAADDLKAKIDEAKRRNDMPIDLSARKSGLGTARRRRPPRRSRPGRRIGFKSALLSGAGSCRARQRTAGRGSG